MEDGEYSFEDCDDGDDVADVSIGDDVVENRAGAGDMLCARVGDQRPVTRYTVCHPYTGLWYHHCIAKSPLCILSLIFLGFFFLLFFLFLLFHFQ